MRNVSMVSVVASFLIFQHAFAAEPVKGHVDQVSLFKNGIGFFNETVPVPSNTPKFSIIPAAAFIHGSFWVSYPSELKIQSIIAIDANIGIATDAVSISEMLRANPGKKIRVTIQPDQKISGVIRSVAQDRARPLADPYSPGDVDSRPRQESYYQSQPITAQIVIIDTNSGPMVLNTSVIQRVDFLDTHIQTQFIEPKKSILLDVNLQKESTAGQSVTASYLAKGITWAPSYLLAISDKDGNAMLTAKAEIINEVCNLSNTSVNLVTGYPNLQFANVFSPLARKETLAQFLSSLLSPDSQRGNYGVTSNVMMQEVGYSKRDNNQQLPDYGAAEQGRQAEDLFFYPLRNVTLKKGQVGYFPLFTESVPYKHIYEWNIPDYVGQDDVYRYDNNRKKETDEVWHCLSLENLTKVPWTTAPAQIVSQNLILGQDTLKYTPVSAKGRLRITRASNIKAQQVENEIDRKRDAAHMYGNSFDLITVKGQLSITNIQQKSISIEITKTISGEVTASTPQAAIEKLGSGISSMNSTCKLTWTVPMEPNQQQNIEYTYQVYVRR